MSEHEDSCLCCQCMQDQRNALEVENDQLRARVRELEDQLRWRKWPEEKPKIIGVYLVLTGNSELDCEAIHFHDQTNWHIHGRPVLYWRPIGPLPGGE